MESHGGPHVVTRRQNGCLRICCCVANWVSGRSVWPPFPGVGPQRVWFPDRIRSSIVRFSPSLRTLSLLKSCRRSSRLPAVRTTRRPLPLDCGTGFALIVVSHFPEQTSGTTRMAARYLSLLTDLTLDSEPQLTPSGNFPASSVFWAVRSAACDRLRDLYLAPGSSVCRGAHGQLADVRRRN